MEIHYAIGGADEPVLLLHGVPKTMSYWRHVVPLLTPHYTVIRSTTEAPAGIPWWACLIPDRSAVAPFSSHATAKARQAGTSI